MNSPLPSANPFVTQQRSIPFKRTSNKPKTVPSIPNPITSSNNTTPTHQQQQNNKKKLYPNPYLRQGLSIDKPKIRNPYLKTKPPETTTQPSPTKPTPANSLNPSNSTNSHPKFTTQTSNNNSSFLLSENDMDIDSIISQLETDELSKDFSIHNKMKKKIKLTKLPKQINVNRFPINSPSPSTSSASSSSNDHDFKSPTTSPTHSSTNPPHLNNNTSPTMPPYPITNPIQDIETLTDLNHQKEHQIDTELIKIYGDTVHRNLGTHLTGNITNDPQWYYIWFQLISYHHPLYTPPQSKLGRDIVKTIAAEFEGVRNRKWNSEKALLFPIIILRKSHQKLNSQEIKHRLQFRLDQWNKGHFIELATDTITEAYQYHESKSPDLDMDEKLQIFNQLVYHGKLREALRFLTNKHDDNVILQPDDIDTKTGKSVLEVLKSKHPQI